MAAQLQQTIVGGQENSLDITLVSLLAKVQFSYELQGEAVGKCTLLPWSCTTSPRGR